MSIQIHAAIVSGVCSGSLVLFGVVVAEVFRRQADRQRDLETNVRELALLVPEFAFHISKNGPNQTLEYGEPGRRLQQRIVKLLAATRRTLAFPMSRKRQNAIGLQLDDVDARVWFAFNRVLRGGAALSEDEQISAASAQLWTLVFGEHQRLDQMVEQYEKTGLPATPSEDGGDEPPTPAPAAAESK